MKRLPYVLAFVVIIMTACNTAPVNIEAEEAAVSALFEDFYVAFNKGDVETMSAFLCDEILACGSDPSEFMNREELVDLWTQLMTVGGPELKFISEQKIKIADDGCSAVVVDQFYMPIFSSVIPFRKVYQLVKTNDQWMIHFLGVSFIPRNKDIAKISSALEE